MITEKNKTANCFKTKYQTYADLIKAALDGEIRLGHTAWYRGYVSRKFVPDDKRRIYYSPRKKAYYVLLPSYRSTRYCYRVWYFEVQF